LRFTHHITRISLAVQIEKGGVRYYQTPQGNLYPSITTVLSKTSDMSALDDWRERVGNEIADKIMSESKTLGTITHQLCEDYLNNRPSEGDLPNIAKTHFENLKPFLHKMGNIHGTELALYSDDFQIAGTCDCIAEYNGILSIIDFKTSRGKLMEYYDKVQKYFVQATAYSLMWKERTGTEIDRIVIIGSEESGDVSEFIKSPGDFIELLFDKLEKFRQLESS